MQDDASEASSDSDSDEGTLKAQLKKRKPKTEFKKRSKSQMIHERSVTLGGKNWNWFYCAISYSESEDDGIVVLRLKPKTSQYNDFKNRIQQYCYLKNAFPSVEESRLSTDEIVFQLKKISPDSNASSDSDLVDTVHIPIFGGKVYR